MKQAPVAFLFAVAVVLSLVVPTIEVTNATALIAAVVVMAAITALAAILPRFDPSGRVLLLIPALDFLVVGILRFATGESASIFASLAILPTVWVAALPGRRNVAYAFLGVCAGLLVPFLLGSTLEENPNELMRGVFSASAFGLAAAVVNDLARLARNHVADVRAREQLALLELEEASVVQQALVPKTGSGASGYDFAGICLPAKTIGGDFFDWYNVAGGTAFTLGDVMGKGVGAGIIAAAVRAVIRSARNTDDLSVPLDRASDFLEADLGDTDSFATLFHARLEETTGVVRYVDAGHGLSLHVRADGSWTRLASLNLPVGMWRDEPWAIAQVLLEPGDALISCSDGILDLYDGTVEALRHVAAIVADRSSASDVVARICALVVGSDAHEDDVTVIILSR
ncbi:SpoIIE family protein phosphatase [Cryobacterium sp. PH31-AA6]|uniref:PP2C family protein-serine/threonine phosphatase n=1 Tax=Cryobacterium sp. PH31-AA6 TaxID=3046205 RepID=UPI0024B93506|nr:SpoIIE family protein phosphatase [Cryobacterium sp. PH31-AA6]MDJ0325482.1 SpoIIE family protein phosphatase [Cryobacterium sp. PH31-AA6]